MRSFRLSGVVVATLLGVGAVAQRPVPDSLTGQPSGPAGADPLSGSELTAATHNLAGSSAAWPSHLLQGPGAPHADHSLLPMTGDLVPAPQPPPPPPPPPVVTVVATPAPVAAAATPAPTPTPAPSTPVVTAATSGPAPASSATWQALRECESGDDYSEDTGNGYYGAYQFAASTWSSLGFPGLPSDASPALQNLAAARLQRLDGWSAWPVCSEAVGL